MIQEAQAHKAEQVAMTIRVHPEIRRALKARAALDGATMETLLHAILCRELDRPDLLDVFTKA